MNSFNFVPFSYAEPGKGRALLQPSAHPQRAEVDNETGEKSGLGGTRFRTLLYHSML